MMSIHRIILLLTVILLGTCYCENNCSYTDILQIMSKLPGADVRPVKNWQSPTTVSVDMSLYTIVNLDTALQVLTTFIWFKMEWKNEFLSWNPNDYCGIEDVLIPNNNFWLPDLYIYEMTENDNNNPVITYYNLNSNGTILSSKPLRIISSCNLDIYKFPFDIQTCSLSFGPYIHTVKDINMVPMSDSSQVNEDSLGLFVSKGDWYLLEISVHTDNFIAGGNYSIVVYMITIERAPIIYIINLIIPACFMVILDIASMFIPMESKQRLGFKITVLLGFSVLLLILNNMVPSIEDPPALAIFFCVCLIAMVVSTICYIATSYMLELSKEQTNVPPWIKVCIVKHLARILFFNIKAPQQDETVSLESAEKDGGISLGDLPSGSGVKDDGGISLGDLPSGSGVKDDNTDCKKTETSMNTQTRKTDKETDTTIPVEVKVLKRLLTEVLKIRQKIEFSKVQDEVKSDWYIVSIVVDRLVLILYLLVAIGVFISAIVIWSK